MNVNIPELALPPLLDMLRRVVSSLAGDLPTQRHAGQGPDFLDSEWKRAWETELIDGLTEDARLLRRLLRNPGLAQGDLRATDEEAEAVIRICSALRLRLRATCLLSLDDRVLETSALEPADLPPAQREGYVAYLLLAAIQERIVAALDASIG